MSVEAAQRAAEQAVLRAAVQRGWLPPAAVGEARRAAEAAGTPLLAALGPRLSPEQRQALGEVFRQTLAEVGAGQVTRAAPATRAGPPPAGPETRTGDVEDGQATRAGPTTALFPREGGAPRAGALPSRIGPYEVERELARGGMGAVFVARSRELGRQVALKVMLPEADEGGTGAARFEREARVLAQLRHPNIVTLHDAGVDAGRPWMALELVSGGSLHGRLASGGPLDPTLAVELMVPVARAIAAAHAQSLLHRDLKPANILMDDQGRPKVTDFGIAKPLDGRTQLTRTGAPVGTASYASPEQCGTERPIDVRSDVYGLGATLYALLTGAPPFDGDSYVGIIARVLRHDPEPPSRRRPGVPPELDLVVLRCLEKAADERYPTAGALADELERWLRGEPLEVQPPTFARRVRRWRRRRPWLAAALVALPPLLALGGVAAWALRAQAPARIPVSVDWSSPQDGHETRAASVTIQGLIHGPAEWVEVGVEGAGAPRRVRQGNFELEVALRPGDNALALRWRASTGEAGALPLRHVTQTTLPRWFDELPADQRPPPPLPDGIDCTATRGVYLARKDRSELVWIPPAKFTMFESSWALVDMGRSKTEQPRPTTLTRGCFIGRHEVTWAQLDAFCAATGRPARRREVAFKVEEIPSASADMENKRVALETPFVPGDDHPAFRVTWEDAREYCAWAGLRLPTEAEWELAGRGTDARNMAWGNEPPSKGECNCLNLTDGYSHTSPVGKFPRDLTPSGCFDMTGNVSEWVADVWAEVGTEPAVDPTGPAQGPTRVVRGAPWSVSPGNVRLTARYPGPPDAATELTGFRVAR